MGFFEEIAEEICEEVAWEAVEEAVGVLDSSPANEGQESLCMEMMDQVEESWQQVFEGEPPIIIESPHPEAVGIIAEECSSILSAAAAACRSVRAAAEAAEIF